MLVTPTRSELTFRTGFFTKAVFQITELRCCAMVPWLCPLYIKTCSSVFFLWKPAISFLSQMNASRLIIVSEVRKTFLRSLLKWLEGGLCKLGRWLFQACSRTSFRASGVQRTERTPCLNHRGLWKGSYENLIMPEPCYSLRILDFTHCTYACTYTQWVLFLWIIWTNTTSHCKIITQCILSSKEDSKCKKNLPEEEARINDKVLLFFCGIQPW